MTRDEHLAESKKRALAYLDRGDVASAVASMMKDLDEHPETKNQSQILAGFALRAAANGDAAAARRYIEGFR